MDKNNQFSIVIPTYNSENYIEDTLNSVFIQTYSKFEIIIVDDGSTDNTVDKIKLILSNNKKFKFKLIIQENSGPSLARNNGILNSNADWIAFLDSDDIWMKNKLEKINYYINKYKDCNFFCHNESMLDLNGKIFFNDYYKNYSKKVPLSKQLYHNNLFSTSAVVCKKKLLLRHNGFDESFFSAQDYELWLRMSDNISLFFINENLGKYIMRKHNISNSNYFQRLFNLLRIKFLHKKKVNMISYIKSIIFVVFYHLITPLYKKIKYLNVLF